MGAVLDENRSSGIPLLYELKIPCTESRIVIGFNKERCSISSVRPAHLQEGIQHASHPDARFVPLVSDDPGGTQLLGSPTIRMEANGEVKKALLIFELHPNGMAVPLGALASLATVRPAREVTG